MRAERAGQLAALALGVVFVGWLALRGGDDDATERARIAAEAKAAAAAQAEAAERERMTRSSSEGVRSHESARELRGDELDTSLVEGASALRPRTPKEERDRASSDPLRNNQVLPIHLDRLRRSPNRAVVKITGLDPDPPRELVAWRIKDGRSALLVRGESDETGQLQFPPVVAAGSGLEIVITDADSRPELPGASEVRKLAPRPPEPPQGRVLDAFEGEALVRIVPIEASGEVLLADMDGTVFARYPISPIPGSGARVFDVALELYGDELQVLMAHEFEDGRRSDWRALAVEEAPEFEEFEELGEFDD